MVTGVPTGAAGPADGTLDGGGTAEEAVWEVVATKLQVPLSASNIPAV